MKRPTTSSFIKRSKTVYGQRLDYSKTIYINSLTKLKFRCIKHDKWFEQLIQNHLLKDGCPDCISNKRSNSAFSNTREFIEKSRVVHGDLYDYSGVVYINNITKVSIKCSIHGEYFQAPDRHLLGHGCHQCGIECITLTQGEFIERCVKKHDHTYDYSKAVYTINIHKVIIICKSHGEFLQVAADHMNGKGCPKCARRISKPETEWLNFIGIPNDFIHRQVKLITNQTKRGQKKQIQVDGFDPKTNTVYEFYGDYWHGNPARFKGINKFLKKRFTTLYKNTMDRETRLKKAGYKIVSIWESDWNLLKSKTVL
jgi:Zn finger protein HypA/HybF involved in hydrogenase expression